MSSPVKRARLARLDELGEDYVFGRYVELGSLGRVAAELFEPVKEDAKDWGRREIYKWLRAEAGRWDRWTEAKRDRGHVEADKVSEVADEASAENAAASRIKIDAHKWRAERLNRTDYGPPQQQVNVALSFGNSWLEALRAAVPDEVVVNEAIRVANGATHTEGTLRARAGHEPKEHATDPNPKSVPDDRLLAPPSSKQGGES